MRQSVYLALIGASSAIRISQTAQGNCAWSAKDSKVGTAPCTNVTTGNCGSQAEADANTSTATLRSCNGTFSALSQGDCTWSNGAVGTAPCTNKTTGNCGSQAEADANTSTATLRSCNGTFSGMAQKK